jgi:hypothetical protein
MGWICGVYIARRQRELEKAYGKEKCWGSLQLKNPPQGAPAASPAYEPITVDGKAKMIEHRRMEPIFHITGDAAVWKQYEATGCMRVIRGIEDSSREVGIAESSSSEGRPTEMPPTIDYFGRPPRAQTIAAISQASGSISRWCHLSIV